MSHLRILFWWGLRVPAEGMLRDRKSEQTYGETIHGE